MHPFWETCGKKVGIGAEFQEPALSHHPSAPQWYRRADSAELVLAAHPPLPCVCHPSGSSAFSTSTIEAFSSSLLLLTKTVIGWAKSLASLAIARNTRSVIQGFS